jgi:hypothetical protein
MASRWNKLLIFDLDDTLIHARAPSHAALPWPPQRMIERYRVHIRPGARELLAWARVNVEGLGIWTSGNLAYARSMLQALCDPRRLDLLWTREHCEAVAPSEAGQPYAWNKPLARLLAQGWTRAQILVIDDKPGAVVGGESNVIAMPPFEGDPADRELVRLRRYLERIAALPDVSLVDKRAWTSEVVLSRRELGDIEP